LPGCLVRQQYLQSTANTAKAAAGSDPLGPNQRAPLACGDLIKRGDYFDGSESPGYVEITCMRDFDGHDHLFRYRC
jgi:hypothetical protein